MYDPSIVQQSKVKNQYNVLFFLKINDFIKIAYLVNGVYNMEVEKYPEALQDITNTLN